MKGKLGQFKKQRICYWISPESQIGKLRNLTWAGPQCVEFQSEDQGKQHPIINEKWLLVEDQNETQPKNQRNDPLVLYEESVFTTERTCLKGTGT